MRRRVSIEDVRQHQRDLQALIQEQTYGQVTRAAQIPEMCRRFIRTFGKQRGARRGG